MTASWDAGIDWLVLSSTRPFGFCSAKWSSVLGSVRLRGSCPERSQLMTA